MTKDEIIACLQALSRIEGATFDIKGVKATLIGDNIEFIAEKLLKMVKDKQ